MTEYGRSPLIRFDDLADMGYKAVIYPLSAFRAAMRTAELVLKTLLQDGIQQGVLDQMQTRAELYELLGYSDWEARDQAFFAATPTRQYADPK
jgi:methylisocitrate lyase